MISTLIKYRHFIGGGFVILLVATAAIWQYNSGYKACETDLKEAQIEADRKSISGSNAVRKKEESLDYERLIRSLDDLGILRDS